MFFPAAMTSEWGKPPWERTSRPHPAERSARQGGRDARAPRGFSVDCSESASGVQTIVELAYF